MTFTNSSSTSKPETAAQDVQLRLEDLALYNLPLIEKVQLARDLGALRFRKDPEIDSKVSATSNVDFSRSLTADYFLVI